MKVSTIIDEDFTNYKTPSMFIGAVSCGGKCCVEAGIPLSVCQNDGWRSRAAHAVSVQSVVERYIRNPITQAIIFGGLEPFEQFDDVAEFVRVLRTEYHCNDTVVIYTGYYPDELEDELKTLSSYPNIIIKFGRYIPDSPHRFDDVLGVELASDNQYAIKIS